MGALFVPDLAIGGAKRVKTVNEGLEGVDLGTLVGRHGSRIALTAQWTVTGPSGGDFSDPELGFFLPALAAQPCILTLPATWRSDRTLPLYRFGSPAVARAAGPRRRWPFTRSAG